MAEPKGWELLQSKLPKEALRSLPEEAYGIAGLTDIDDTYLLERLYASGLRWTFGKPEFNTTKIQIKRKGELVDGWLTVCDWSITIQNDANGIVSEDGSAIQTHWARGVHQDVRAEVAMKGAQTGAFKALCKWLGMDKDVRRGKSGEDLLHSDGEVAPATPPCPKCGSSTKVRDRKDGSGKFVACTAWRKDGTGCDWIGAYSAAPAPLAWAAEKEAAPAAGPKQGQALAILQSGKISASDMALAFQRAGLPEKMTPSAIKDLSDEVATVLVEALQDLVAA